MLPVCTHCRRSRSVGSAARHSRWVLSACLFVLLGCSGERLRDDDAGQSAPEGGAVEADALIDGSVDRDTHVSEAGALDAASDAALPTIPDARSESGVGDAAARPPDATVADRVADTLLDGRPGITFAAFTKGGGMAAPGSEVMAENGHWFLIAEGDGTFWIQHGRLTRVLTGVLSASDASLLRQQFRLDRFQEYAGDHPQAGFDFPDAFYVFGRGGLRSPCAAEGAAGGCIHLGAGSRVGVDVGWLYETARRLMEQLAARAREVEGPIRYLLVEGESAVPNYHWQQAARWPLGDPAALAISQARIDMGYVEGTSRLATGADADALREVWRKFLSYEVSGREPNMPPGVSLAIPIQTEGARHQLFLRDSIRLEDAKGLISY